MRDSSENPAGLRYENRGIETYSPTPRVTLKKIIKMSNKKKKCCDGCKKGQPGQNKACAAKLMMEKLKEAKDVAALTKV